MKFKRKIMWFALGLSVTLAGGGLLALNYDKAVNLRAEECVHEHVEHYVGIAPTQETYGKREHWACCDCGKRWEDSAKTKLTTNEDLIIAKVTQMTAASSSDFVSDLSTSISNFVLNDSKVAAYVSQNDGENIDIVLSSSSAIEVYSIYFDYKGYNINSTTFSSSIKVGDSYENVDFAFDQDNEWHEGVINVEAKLLTELKLSFTNFSGEILIANLSVNNGLKFSNTYDPSKTMNILHVADPVKGVDYTTNSNDPVNVVWKQDGEVIDRAPVAAGSYEVELQQGNVKVRKAFTISPVMIAAGSNASGYQTDTGILTQDVTVKSGCSKIYVDIQNTSSINCNVLFVVYSKTAISAWGGKTTLDCTQLVKANTTGKYTIDLLTNEGFTLNRLTIKRASSSDNVVYQCNNFELVDEDFMLTEQVKTNRSFNGGYMIEPIFGTDLYTMDGNIPLIQYYKVTEDGNELMTEVPHGAGNYVMEISKGSKTYLKDIKIASVYFANGWGTNVISILNNIVIPAGATQLWIKGSCTNKETPSVGFILSDKSGSIYWQGNASGVVLPGEESKHLSYPYNNGWSVAKDLAISPSADTKITIAQFYGHQGADLTIEDIVYTNPLA